MKKYIHMKYVNTSFKSMYSITAFFCCFVSLYTTAQINHFRTVHKEYEDTWSNNDALIGKDYYSEINSEHFKILMRMGGSKRMTSAINDVIKHQREEIETFSLGLYFYKESLKKFVNNGRFNNSSGYNSYGYIKKKYPVANPLNPNPKDALRNSFIRNRFYKKLNKEGDNIDAYLDYDNPVPEGERILLILKSLQNVINITLENETY